MQKVMEEIPTPEQKRLAARCLEAVRIGKIPREEGHGWLEKIFSGKLDKKQKVES